MGKQYQIVENDIKLVFEISEQGEVFFLHCQKSPFVESEIAEEQKDWFRLVEVQTAGEDCDDHHGSKYTGTLPGRRLIFVKLKDERTEKGRNISVFQEDPVTGLRVISHFRFTGKATVVESWTEVINSGNEPIGLTYVSSFCLNGLTKSTSVPWDQAAALKIPSNGWYGEFQWKNYSLPELGLYKVFHYSTKRLSFSATGTWNSHEQLPMGYIENCVSKEGWLFSIIHNGSWQWEISDSKDALYLHLSGPTEAENHWYKQLQSGECFETVHTAVAITDTGFTEAVAELTRWRRLCRRPNEDNEKLPVIFNDFMNCLGGDPNEEKEYPLIDAAAKIGCEYYTIDAGWYANGSWWSRVGEWEPARKRWPNGINKVLSYIRSKGMVPGLWLELEVMGIHCPVAESLPDDWFFMRHGKRVIDHGRYQLDYRNPKVREFADSVIARLVEEYGAGYIKMDYNINAGIGTEIDSDSAGDGLLGHNRAYLEWLDSVWKRYPNLIIENCGSGGMRINDALLSRHSIQSSSDQTDYLRYAAISAAAPAALTPEQNAVWSYPLSDADAEQTVFNMINAMTMRIHQSGHLGQLSEENLALIKEAIDYYKSYRHLIPKSFTFWPLGMPSYNGQRFAVGFASEECAHIAVWRVDAPEETVILPLGEMHKLPGMENKKIAEVKIVYPKKLSGTVIWHECTDSLEVMQPMRSARLLRVKFVDEMECGKLY